MSVENMKNRTLHTILSYILEGNQFVEKPVPKYLNKKIGSGGYF